MKRTLFTFIVHAIPEILDVFIVSWKTAHLEDQGSEFSKFC